MLDTTRRRVMIGTLALAGAAGGGVAGYLATPDVPGVVASLAVAGLGLGGALGVIFGGGWRSAPEPVAAPEPEPEPAPEPEPQPEPDPEPPPPEGGEAGWYEVPGGGRRFWNGSAWTTHVWRERDTPRPRRLSRRR